MERQVVQSQAGRGRRQRGASLLVAIMVLIAMTLSAVGLMRSMFTSNRIAGNLSFQQSATQSADAGIEDAIFWLEANSGGTTLHFDRDISGAATRGYFASSQNPAAGQSWEQYWDTVLVPTGRVNALPEDAAGNRVSYVIHRLCAGTGNPASGIGCAVSPDVGNNEGNSNQSGSVAIIGTPQRYYRITVRVDGPRNTLSFVQSTVAL